MVGMWVRSDNHIEPVYTKVAKIRDNVLGCGLFAAGNQHIHAVRFNKRAISLPNVDIMHGNFSLGGKPARCFGKSGKIIYIFPILYLNMCTIWHFRFFYNFHFVFLLICNVLILWFTTTIFPGIKY